ncbi:MAG: SGNH/GDSL hydrolase family protein [Pirellulales bacterium]
MRFPCCVLTIVLGGMFLVAMSSSTLVTAQEKPAQAKQARPNPALQPIEEDPNLPRVLLIGDSISMGYTLPVRELLKGKANVVRPNTNCGPSSRGVESLEQWLGKGKWDVIHFNFGLHDLVYFAENGKDRAEKTTPGARHQVPLPQYEANLRKIVARLKQTGAKVIWASTTPVPEGSANRAADESVLFNEVAAKIMQENQIEIDDLHTYAKAKLAEIQLPKNVHFSPEGSKVLAKKVAEVVESHLPKRP